MHVAAQRRPERRENGGLPRSVQAVEDGDPVPDQGDPDAIQRRYALELDADDRPRTRRDAGGRERIGVHQAGLTSTARWDGRCFFWSNESTTVNETRVPMGGEVFPRPMLK